MEIVPHAFVAAFGSCLFLFLLLFYNLSAKWASLPRGDISTFSEHTLQTEGLSTVAVDSAFTLSIPIDHFNSSDKRTFQNRYWLNRTFYEPGGPVFLFDIGEDLLLLTFEKQAVARISS